MPIPPQTKGQPELQHIKGVLPNIEVGTSRSMPFYAVGGPLVSVPVIPGRLSPCRSTPRAAAEPAPSASGAARRTNPAAARSAVNPVLDRAARRAAYAVFSSWRSHSRYSVTPAQKKYVRPVLTNRVSRHGASPVPPPPESVQ